ncbi:YybH family protein [Undibacterium arcticum]|uniref:YybH family protein n=1 Tax=Undibacterium arcticum TaxID=1762892 RepID=A0ABV7EX70_9BURK
MPRGQQLNGSATETEAAFYDALARADLEALMALWADDEEIVCIHPGAPRLLGHAAIRASWEAIFENGGVHINPVLLHQTHNLMSAIHNVVEEVKERAGAQSDMHILATNVFVKTPHGWRIVAHHASVAPGKAQQEAPKASLLH